MSRPSQIPYVNTPRNTANRHSTKARLARTFQAKASPAKISTRTMAQAAGKTSESWTTPKSPTASANAEMSISLLVPAVTNTRARAHLVVW